MKMSWQEGGMCPCKKEEHVLFRKKEYVKAGRKKSPGKKEKCILTGTRKCPYRKAECIQAKWRNMFWQVEGSVFVGRRKVS